MYSFSGADVNNRNISGANPLYISIANHNPLEVSSIANHNPLEVSSIANHNPLEVSFFPVYCIRINNVKKLSGTLLKKGLPNSPSLELRQVL